MDTVNDESVRRGTGNDERGTGNGNGCNLTAF
jgi:hypothetical protein